MENIKTRQFNKVKLSWLDKGHGKAVVFIPGSNGDYRAWLQQVDEFSKNFRTISVSRRFQFPDKFEIGGSSTIDENIDDIKQLVDFLKLDKFVLIGHSFGGYVALAFAEKYPQLIDKLVLEEPTVFPFLMTKAFNPLKLIPLMFKDFGVAISFLRTGLKGIKPTRKYLSNNELQKAKLSFANGIVGHPIKLEELNPTMRQGLDDNIKTFAAESKTAFAYPLSVERMRKMEVKTLLLESDKSPKWFAYICKNLEQTLPNAKLVKINSPTHWLHLDLPNDFNRTVIDFVNQDKI
ncbi:MAG: alpha/beta hydrolase [Saprospiraceae bacterium]|nr:alpha/beta hydrolase [Saprospiraceae bacterium]MBK8298233.1 alpha/beta hydrolase [Saprospiraceae bacterium]